MRVLLVDDNPDLLTIYGGLLVDAGHEVTTAPHGRAALDLLDEMRSSDRLPELVLLDMDMPELDGVATASAIRDTDDLAELTIVALTSHELPDEIDQALDAGCDAYVVKPGNPTALLDELRLLLDEL